MMWKFMKKILGYNLNELIIQSERLEAIADWVQAEAKLREDADEEAKESERVTESLRKLRRENSFAPMIRAAIMKGRNK